MLRWRVVCRVSACLTLYRIAGNLLDDCVPDSLFDLPNLRRLNLAGNRLEVVPLLCMFVNLEYVNLTRNPIRNGAAQRESFLQLIPSCTFEI